MSTPASDRTIRWGVLSTAKIGTKKVIPATQQAANCHVAAICSRNADRAREVADELNIPKSYGSYEELLADPEIDAIYNPLPNHLHVPWSLKAIEAGKHVLCEKPLGLTSTEAELLVDASLANPQLKVMEAFMYRHHPQWQKARELVRSGALGRLCTVDVLFSYFNRDAGDIRNQADLGGGALMDIGCYPISLSRFLFDREPEQVQCRIDLDPEFQTDRLASAILDFGDATATFTCSTQMTPYQRVHVVGTEGRFEIEIPFNAPPDVPCKAWLQQGETIEEIVFPVCDQYTIQAELFAQAILDDTDVPTPLIDGVQNMLVLEALVRSDYEKAWIKPGE